MPISNILQPLVKSLLSFGSPIIPFVVNITLSFMFVLKNTAFNAINLPQLIQKEHI